MERFLSFFPQILNIGSQVIRGNKQTNKTKADQWEKADQW